MRMSATRKGAAAALFMVSTTVLSADVHQHGLAQAAVVVEGETLTVNFRAPLMDIIGTEQPPGDAASRARYRDRLQEVTAPVPTSRAQCALSDEARTTVDALFPVSETHGDHDHEHHDHGHGDGHRDVEAEWTFRCRAPSELNEVTLPFLDTFSGLTTEVVLLLPAGQDAVRLAHGDTRIPLE